MSTRDDFHDQLVDELTGDLSAKQRRALMSATADQAEIADQREALEAAAAVYDLARLPKVEALPDELRQRLLRSMPTGPATSGPRSDSAVAVSASPSRRSGRAMPWLAAAAALVLAVAGWWPRIEPQILPAPVVEEAPPLRTLSMAERRDIWLRAHPDAVRVALGGTDHEASSTDPGYALWDPESQTGYLTLSGLDANDPSVHQYQLWIVDGNREGPPVDGGVFDLSRGGEVVQFTPKLPVGSVAAFAITREQPGGVVVSAQEEVVAIGAVNA